jgi:hypothetical protein
MEQFKQIELYMCIYIGFSDKSGWCFYLFVLFAIINQVCGFEATLLKEILTKPIKAHKFTYFHFVRCKNSIQLIQNLKLQLI